MPVFPLQGALLLPGGILPLNIFEPRYIQMVKDTLATNHRLIVMTLPLPEKSNGSEIYKLACAGKLISFEETLDGRFLISLSGIMRCRLLDTLEEKGGYRRMKVDFTDYLDDMRPNDIKIERNGFFKTLRSYFDMKGLSADWKAIEKCEDEKLITTLAMLCPFSDAEKQTLMEANSLNERAKLMKVILEMSIFGTGDQNVKKH
ncbi:LON peptidase substrate-binding domain-containing protein [SAR116 cluster bacterium]|nr:LON peptidase substrate-binding domain-containing protein [SAR116 cluster bacterium]